MITFFRSYYITNETNDKNGHRTNISLLSSKKRPWCLIDHIPSLQIQFVQNWNRKATFLSLVDAKIAQDVTQTFSVIIE